MLMKTAGQIDDVTFKREARELMKMAEGAAPSLVRRAWESAKGIAGKGLQGAKDAFTARQLRAGLSDRKAVRDTYKNIDRKTLKNDPVVAEQYKELMEPARKNILAGAGKTLGAYGGAAAGLTGGAYLGKQLYDKYSG